MPLVVSVDLPLRTLVVLVLLVLAVVVVPVVMAPGPATWLLVPVYPRLVALVARLRITPVVVAVAVAQELRPVPVVLVAVDSSASSS